MLDPEFDARVRAAIARWRLQQSIEALSILVVARRVCELSHEAELGSLIAEALDSVEAWPPQVAPYRRFVARRRLDRFYAARDLKACGEAALPAMQGVLSLRAASLRSDGRDLVFQALAILDELGAAAAPAVPAVIKILKQSPDQTLQAAAIKVLGSIGPAARAAIPAMLLRTASIHAEIRGHIAEALRLIEVGTPEVCEFLVVALHDPHLRVRAESAQSLGALANNATPEIVAALCHALNDSSKRVRAYSVAALCKLRPRPKEALPLIEAMLADGRLKGQEHLASQSIAALSGTKSTI